VTRLVDQLAAQGFLTSCTGGGCHALVRRRDGYTDVVTTRDGLDLPTRNDWLLCTYGGEWAGDPPLASVTNADCVTDLIGAVRVVAVSGRVCEVTLRDGPNGGTEVTLRPIPKDGVDVV